MEPVYKYRWAVFGRLNDYLGEVFASSDYEALAKAKILWSYTERVILIRPGNDLGTDGLI